MACIQILNGIGIDCASSMGGIQEVYLNNRDSISAVTVDETAGMIVNIAVRTSGATAEKFKVYKFRKGTGSMTSTLNVDAANGINYVNTDLALIFNRQDTPKRIEMSALSLGELVAIVKDCNGKYWYLGYDEALTAISGGAESGAGRSDRNAYTLTLQDNSHTYPYEILIAETSEDEGVLLSDIVDF